MAVEELPARGARTRLAVLDAAVERFGRDGYRSTSVADVAREVGISGPAVYAYFPTKQALFVAAVDQDAAALIDEAVGSVLRGEGGNAWRETLVLTLLDALPAHPLARRVLGGLEPDFTVRLLEIPALEQLRKACTERLRVEQLENTVRSDIDPAQIANGLVTIVLSLLISLVQVGREAATLLGADVAAVISAALDPPRS
jgi:AcrR family transcriptional regulator